MLPPAHPSIKKKGFIQRYLTLFLFTFSTIFTTFNEYLTVCGTISGRARCHASSNEQQPRQTSNIETPPKDTCHHPISLMMPFSFHLIFSDSFFRHFPIVLLFLFRANCTYAKTHHLTHGAIFVVSVILLVDLKRAATLLTACVVRQRISIRAG